MARWIRPSELSQPEQRRAFQQIVDALKQIQDALDALTLRVAALEAATAGLPALLLAGESDIGHLLAEDGDTLWVEDWEAPLGIEIATPLV